MSWFSGEMTESLLRVLSETNICNSINAIYLHDSGNFERNEAVEQLTKLLARSTSIKNFDITLLTGERKIKVEMKYAVE